MKRLMRNIGLLRAGLQNWCSTIIIGTTVLTVVLLVYFLYPGSNNIHGLYDASSGFLIGYFFLAMMFASMVKGMTGFGYGTIASPIAATIIDPKAAFVVLSIPALVLNIFQISETGTAFIFLKENKALAITALMGSLLGVIFLNSVSSGPLLSLLLAAIIIIYVVYEVSHGFIQISGAKNPILSALAGGSHGFTFAAFNLGPIFPAYLHLYERDIAKYIGGVAIITGIILVEKILLLTYMGLLTLELAWLGLAITIVTLIGIALGSVVRKRVNQDYLHRGIVGLLFIVAVRLIFTAVLS